MTTTNPIAQDQHIPLAHTLCAKTLHVLFPKIRALTFVTTFTGTTCLAQMQVLIKKILILFHPILNCKKIANCEDHVSCNWDASLCDGMTSSECATACGNVSFCSVCSSDGHNCKQISYLLIHIPGLSLSLIMYQLQMLTNANLLQLVSAPFSSFLFSH